MHSGSGSSSNTTKTYLSCGANFCMIGGGHHDNQNLHRPPDAEIYEISAIYLSCVVVAVLMVALLLDPLSRADNALGPWKIETLVPRPNAAPSRRRRLAERLSDDGKFLQLSSIEMWEAIMMETSSTLTKLESIVVNGLNYRVFASVVVLQSNRIPYGAARRAKEIGLIINRSRPIRL
ncbi:UNC93-like protein [Eumeta japonica]|uniref:UNC93-like protein n=1 Tax=Eumeta variegata TaxID=151549 RepID=A0A4C1SH99_EUMVA|nr:UNC93-like protein [Eumeta japonica]